MGKLNRNHSISFAGFFLAVIILIFISGTFLYNIYHWSDYPDFGYGFRNATGIKIIGTLTQHGKRSGLKLGDQIGAVNGKSYNSIKELRGIMNREIGDNNEYFIIRDGKEFSVRIDNIPLGFVSTFSKSGLSYLAGLCYVFIGVIIFLMKPNQRTSWIFFLFSAILGLFLMLLYRTGKIVTPWLETIIIFSYCFTPAVISHLALTFPEERPFFRNRPFIQSIPYIVAALLFVLIRSKASKMTGAPVILLISTMSYMALGVLFFLGSCLNLLLTSKSEMAKLRSKMILLGFAISALIPLIDFFANAVLKVYLLPGFSYYFPFFIIFPIFVGYSIVKHDLFDIDTIIKRTYGYVLTTGTLAGLYGLFVLISNVAFGHFEITQSRLFPLVFMLAVVFFFNPIRNRVQRIIDRLFYRLEYDYQETVQNISETMRSLLKLDEIGKSIMDTALGAMFIDCGCVMLMNQKKENYQCLTYSGEWAIPDRADSSNADQSNAADTRNLTDGAGTETRANIFAGVELSYDDPLVKKISERKKEVTIYDVQEDPFYKDNREAYAEIFERLNATLIIPLIYEHKLIGLISLGRKKSGKFYRREDVNLLNILANQGAVAIENAIMIEEVIEKERMEEELNIAKDLQVSMLPAACPDIKGLEIAAYSMSAQEVGGDFYDFIDMSEEKVGMLIGDVTGKSVSGALVMSASRSVFRMLSEEDSTVADIMIRANRRIKKDIKRGMFVALLYAVVDSHEKTIALCSAGQTQPVYIPAGSENVSLIETRGDTFPLGILDDVEYVDTHLVLKPGDKIVFYTDGIVEAMNADEEMFGFERLKEVMQSVRGHDVTSVMNETIERVNAFAGDRPQHDDITIIVLGVKPS